MLISQYINQDLSNNMNFFKKNISNSVIDIKRKKLALVTGASSGIGFAFTNLLAEKGYDIIIVARDLQKLSELEDNLSQKYGSKIYPLALDLSKQNCTEDIAQFLEKHNLSVDLLINNAGFGIHGGFHETNIQREINLVQLQINSTLSITKLLLPNMQKNKFGFILNVGSVYSFSPVPYQSVYGACKSFILSFSSSIAHENKSFGIKVCCLCPGITQTEFRARSKIQELSDKNIIEKSSGMSAREVAEQGLNSLLNGELVCVPGLTNRIFVRIATHLPSSLFSSALTLINQVRGVNSKHS